MTEFVWIDHQTDQKVSAVYGKASDAFENAVRGATLHQRPPGGDWRPLHPSANVRTPPADLVEALATYVNDTEARIANLMDENRRLRHALAQRFDLDWNWSTTPPTPEGCEG